MLPRTKSFNYLGRLANIIGNLQNLELRDVKLISGDMKYSPWEPPSISMRKMADTFWHYGASFKIY